MMYPGKDGGPGYPGSGSANSQFPNLNDSASLKYLAGMVKSSPSTGQLNNQGSAGAAGYHNIPYKLNNGSFGGEINANGYHSNQNPTAGPNFNSSSNGSNNINNAAKRISNTNSINKKLNSKGLRNSNGGGGTGLGGGAFSVTGNHQNNYLTNNSYT